jgi:hypothetical protein
MICFQFAFYHCVQQDLKLQKSKAHIHSFILEILIEHLLCARVSWKFQGYSSKGKRQKPLCSWSLHSGWKLYAIVAYICSWMSTRHLRLDRFKIVLDSSSPSNPFLPHSLTQSVALPLIRLFRKTPLGIVLDFSHSLTLYIQCIHCRIQGNPAASTFRHIPNLKSECFSVSLAQAKAPFYFGLLKHLGACLGINLFSGREKKKGKY